MMSGFILIIMTVCVMCAYGLWRKQKRRLNEPPIYPGAWPMIGHVPSMFGLKKFWIFLRYAVLDLAKIGGVGYILAGPIKIYVVCDPDDSLLVANHCLDKSYYYSFADKWFGKSLAMSPSSVWKKDRKVLLPAFNHHVMVGFMETFNEEARKMVDELSTKVGKGSFEHFPIITDYGIDSLCKTVLGVDIPDKDKYKNVTFILIKTMVKRFLFPFLHSETIYNYSNLKKTEDKYTEVMHSIADELIEQKRSELKDDLQSNSGTKNNFLELLLDISMRETMTDKQLRDHLNFMIVAGYTTISITISIILMMIGCHEKVQDKIYKEIVEVFGDTHKDIEQKDLDRLVYLEAVIKESMRVVPAAPMVLREIKEDIKLAKYTLYAGTSCVLLLTGLNTHPIWGEDAQQYKPERWLDPSTLPDHPAAFAGFSIGRRNCIGKYYAMMSMKTFLVHILRNYIVATDSSKMEFSFGLMTKLEPTCHISLLKRT